MCGLTFGGVVLHWGTLIHEQCISEILATTLFGPTITAITAGFKN